MPTVLRTAGFRFYFFSNERNEPPHIHVDRGHASAKIWLGQVLLASSSGYSPAELGDVLRLVRLHRKRLLEAWHGFFGFGG